MKTVLLACSLLCSWQPLFCMQKLQTKPALKKSEIIERTVSEAAQKAEATVIGYFQLLPSELYLYLLDFLTNNAHATSYLLTYYVKNERLVDQCANALITQYGAQSGDVTKWLKRKMPSIPHTLLSLTTQIKLNELKINITEQEYEIYNKSRAHDLSITKSLQEFEKKFFDTDTQDFIRSLNEKSDVGSAIKMLKMTKDTQKRSQMVIALSHFLKCEILLLSHYQKVHDKILEPYKDVTEKKIISIITNLNTMLVMFGCLFYGAYLLMP